MNPRLPLFSLLLLFCFSAVAQQEVSGSIGVWSSDELGKAAAIGASYNRFWTSSFSTRGGAFVARDPEVTSTALQATGELHFFRDGRVSPWLGAGGAVVYTHLAPSNEHFSGNETDIAPLFNGGLDVTISPRLAVGAEVSYLAYDVEFLDRSRTANPLMIVFAARYRY